MKFNEIKISESLIIKEVDDDGLAAVFPVIAQLRPHFCLEKYVTLVKEMKTQGYRAICLYEEGAAVAYAGFVVLQNLYYGRHIWIYDLVTDEARQGRGFGKILLSGIERWGKDNRLENVALQSGFVREGAHRFYESMGYVKPSAVFRKEL